MSWDFCSVCFLVFFFPLSYFWSTLGRLILFHFCYHMQTSASISLDASTTYDFHSLNEMTSSGYSQGPPTRDTADPSIVPGI